MNKQEYGDKNIPDVELAPLAEKYMSLYGININLQRTIPAVQDGLKPVQRRTLYQMYRYYRNNKVRVSVLMGRVLSIHPHGDQGLGDTFARMCQPFTNNIPLLQSLGNSGNVTSGDDAAAPRYLDVVLPDFTIETLFKEFDGKVSMRPSYDDSDVEPISLPARFPLVLLNGTSGIGYTLSTDIPPFNLSEIADATIKLLKNPESKIHLVPDSPTGCDIIVKNPELFIMQSSFEVDQLNYIITIKNTPYLKYLEKIDSDLREIQASNNPIPDILSAEDESELIENNFRYVIRCKPCNLYNVINALFKRVPGFREPLSTSNMVVVDTDLSTKKYNIRQILLSWIKYRLQYKRGWFLRDLVAKTTEHDMLKGKLYILSPENIGKTIKIFTDAKSKNEIISKLVKEYKGNVTSSQANYVSELKMYKLNQTEFKETKEKIKSIEEEIKYIRDVVDDPEKIRDVIIDEIKTIKQKYGYPRRSKILNIGEHKANVSIVQILLDGSVIFAETENPEHLSSDITPISGDEVCLIDDKARFIKINTNKIYHDKPMTLTSIGKGNMGKCVAAVSNPLNNIIILTNTGRIKYMPINKIPSNATRKPLMQLSNDEYIVSILEVADEDNDILVYTTDGMGKRIQTSDLNKVSSLDSQGQYIFKDNNIAAGMFCINSNKPYLVYVTRLGRVRLNNAKFLTASKKFADPKPIIKLSPQDDLIAVFCVDKNQVITLTHADSRISTINIDSLEPTTMSIPPERPKHVPGIKVIRASCES